MSKCDTLLVGLTQALGATAMLAVDEVVVRLTPSATVRATTRAERNTSRRFTADSGKDQARAEVIAPEANDSVSPEAVVLDEARVPNSTLLFVAAESHTSMEVIVAAGMLVC